MKLFMYLFLSVSVFLMIALGVASLGIIVGVLSPELHEVIIAYLKNNE